MARILVTDGEQRAALAIVRSLGLAGHEVAVTSGSGSSLAGASRHAFRDHAVPNALSDPEGYADSVERAASGSACEILIPVTEPSLLSILPRAPSLPFLVPFPSLEAFRNASDKAKVAEEAREVGIAVPDQQVVSSPVHLPDLPEDDTQVFVLKPFRSVSGGRKLGVRYARGGGEILKAVGDLPVEAFPLMIQRRIHGPGSGVFLLMWDGEVRALFAHQRVREKPPSGGVSVVRDSVLVDPDLAHQASLLLRRLEWNGVAMVEFKIEEKTGTPYLMEINGRFWGSLQLAIDSGVDFPRLLVDAALGRESGAPPDYHAGVRCRWLMGDLDHLLARLLKSGTTLNLPPGSPGRGRVVLDFFRDFFPPAHLEVFRWDDLGPFSAEVGSWVRQVWRKK